MLSMRSGLGKLKGVRFQGKLKCFFNSICMNKSVLLSVDKFLVCRFNATDMLERLKNKRVIIVGDSLNRNQWESLACLLYTAIPPSRVHVDVQNGVYKVLRALVRKVSSSCTSLLILC